MSKEMSVPHLKKVRLELDSYSQSLQYHRKYLQKIKAQLKNLSHFSIQKDQALETPRNKKLVHCVLLTFYFNEILERCLAALLPEKNRIDGFSDCHIGLKAGDRVNAIFFSIFRKS